MLEAPPYHVYDFLVSSTSTMITPVFPTTSAIYSPSASAPTLVSPVISASSLTITQSYVL